MEKSQEGITAYARRLRQKGRSPEQVLQFLKKNCENENMVNDILLAMQQENDDEVKPRWKICLNSYLVAGWLVCVAGYSIVFVMRRWGWTALILVFLGGWLINREWEKDRR